MTATEALALSFLILVGGVGVGFAMLAKAVRDLSAVMLDHLQDEHNVRVTKRRKP